MARMIRTPWAVCCSLLAVLVASLGACAEAPPPARPAPTQAHPLEGAWQLRAFAYRSTDTTVRVAPAQGGMFLFTAGHYALQWAPVREPRVPFDTLSAPRDEEVLAAFRSVVFNAGRIVAVTDSTLVTEAAVAKVPGFEGGRQVYRYALDEAAGALTLTMVDETYPDGSKPAWSGTWETVFELAGADPTRR